MTFPWLVIGALGTAVIAGMFGRVTRQWLIAAIVASGLILYLHSTLYFHYTSDDAYISYRYARNFSDGLGLVWNPGEYVEGYTNFLWVVLLAGFDKAGTDLVLTGRWLGFALAIVAAAGTYQLTRDLAPAETGRVAGFAAAVMLAASGPWAVWASAGMEGPLFATLCTAAVLLQIRERPRNNGRRWPPLSGFVWALVCMTRPDGLVLVAVAAAFKLTDTIIGIRSSHARRKAFLFESLRILGWVGAFAIVYVPYFIWRYDAYGWLFPNTYYAKVGSGLKQYDRGLRYSLAFLQEYGGWALLSVPIAVVLSTARRVTMLFVFALVVAWTVAMAYVGGDSLLRFRLFVPILPLYYAIIAASAAALYATASDAIARRTPVPEVVVGGVIIAAVWLTLQPTIVGSGTGAPLRAEREGVEDRVAIGRWLRANVPNDTLIAVIAAGAIPYESRLPSLDMLGLTNEHIAHLDADLGQFAAGHEKFDSDYVLDREPDIIVLAGSLSDRPFNERDRAAMLGFSAVLIPAIPDMYENPRLAQLYEQRVVEIREDQWLNMFVRRDARAVLAKTQPAPE